MLLGKLMQNHSTKYKHHKAALYTHWESLNYIIKYTNRQKIANRWSYLDEHRQNKHWFRKQTRQLMCAILMTPYIREWFTSLGYEVASFSHCLTIPGQMSVITVYWH